MCECLGVKFVCVMKVNVGESFGVLLIDFDVFGWIWVRVLSFGFERWWIMFG